MQEVAGGSFIMGGTPEQKSDALSTDNPTHLVSLPDYYIAETEVTCQLWAEVMGRDTREWAAENGLQDYWISDDCPVVGVSWIDCKEFIRRLDSITGMPFRLPTEAEWEYAGRGGSGTAKSRRNKSEQTRFAGSNDAEEAGWIYRNSGNRVHAVGKKLPNTLGLYDMTGNVWEWCEDSYQPYTNESKNNPIGKHTGDSATIKKIMRGGSWDNAVDNVRLSARRAEKPQYAFHDCGLRLAMDKEPEKEKLKQFTHIRIGTHSYNFVLVNQDSNSPFYLAEEDVTKRLWRSIMRTNNNRKKRLSEAVDGLTAAQCEAFVCQLNAKTKKYFRLPTENEWEMVKNHIEYKLQVADDSNDEFEQFGSNYRKRKAIQRANIYLSLLEYVGIPQIEEPEDYTLQHYQKKGDKKNSIFFADSANDQPEKRHIRLIWCP